MMLSRKAGGGGETMSGVVVAVVEVRSAAATSPPPAAAAAAASFVESVRGGGGGRGNPDLDVDVDVDVDRSSGGGEVASGAAAWVGISSGTGEAMVDGLEGSVEPSKEAACQSRVATSHHQNTTDMTQESVTNMQTLV
jgi:hypothetical protein